MSISSIADKSIFTSREACLIARCYCSEPAVCSFRSSSTGIAFKLVIGSGSLHYVVAAFPEHGEVMQGNLAGGCG